MFTANAEDAEKKVLVGLQIPADEKGLMENRPPAQAPPQRGFCPGGRPLARRGESPFAMNSWSPSHDQTVGHRSFLPVGKSSANRAEPAADGSGGHPFIQKVWHLGDL